MPTINTQIESPYQADIDAERLIAVATSALKVCRVHKGEITIVITSDEAIRSLNRQYRGVDAPTDVLSFQTDSPENEDAGEPGTPFSAMDHFVSLEQRTPYLGDVIISAPTAIKQAQVMEHSMLEEILLLTVHGILHLLGFDHLTAIEKETMWQKQKQILRLNYLEHVQPTENIH